MAKITKFDRRVADQTQDRIQKLLDELADEIGCTADLGRWRCTDKEFKIPVTFRLSDTKALDAEDRKVWDNNYKRLGFAKADRSKQFTYGRKTMKIKTINPSATKNNVVVTDVNNGKDYVMPNAEVLRALGKGKKVTATSSLADVGLEDPFGS